MPNLDLAREMIKKSNEKFKDGSANQDTSLFDSGRKGRETKLFGAQRKAVKEGIEHKIVNEIVVRDPDNQVIERVSTLVPVRAHLTGEWLSKHPEATVGNCGERCFYTAYLLRAKGVANVTILTGASKDSINHDFIVIGATDIPQSGTYSQSTPPAWAGSDIVICDPWFQAGMVSYECGVAYPLADWPTWMPKVLNATLKGRQTEKTLCRTGFVLTIVG